MSAELRVLERLLGTWKEEATYKKAEWVEKERRETAVYRFELSLKGQFIVSRGRSNDDEEDLQVMTFDHDKKAYRRWYFDSTGSFRHSTGQWDEKTSTLTWTGPMGEGITAVSVWKHTDKDTLVWSLVAKDKQGKVYLNIEGKSVRQK
jgi:hypothetical protein